MSKQERPNPYEYLKMQGVSISVSEDDVKHNLNVTENNKETAIIITRKSGEYWYGGFIFYWHHGGVSSKQPKPENGVFKTEREARLYYLGYLSLFLDYYIEDTKIAITAALHKFQQTTLF